jgi:HK97 family phage prohead protease
MSEYRPKLLDTSTWKATLTGEGKLCAVRKEVITNVAVDSGKLNFILSTAAIDRHGDTVAQAGWKLDNYKRNPVVLFGHDQASPPVGKAPYVAVEGDKLVAKGVEFTPKDLSPFGYMIGEMYRQGFMNAVSVGFLPGKFKFAEGRGEMAIDFEEQELLEFSAVPVPANPEALQGAKAAGIEVAPLIEWAERILDTQDGTQTVQRGMAERVWTSLNTRKNFTMKKQEPVVPDEQEVEMQEVEVELPGGMAALVDLLNGLMGEVKMCRKEMVQLVEKMGAYGKALEEEKKPMMEEPMKANGEVVAKKVQAEVKRRIAALLGRVD